MDYDPSKIEKVSISELVFNDWNPKEDEKEYKKVKNSIGLNGLLTAIIVRETDEGLEVVDGNSRAKACKELGFSSVYVYNLGRIDEVEAKSLALWLQTQVPFDEVGLAPLVMELDSLGMRLPYDEKELSAFENLTSFDMDTAFKEEEPEEEFKKEDDGLVIVKYKVFPDDLVLLDLVIKEVVEQEQVNEGRALELLLEVGMKKNQES